MPQPVLPKAVAAAPVHSIPQEVVKSARPMINKQPDPTSPAPAPLAQAPGEPTASLSTTAPPTTTAGVIEPWAEVWNGGNLRSAPGVDAAVVGSVRAGDHVRLAGWASDWWWVHTADGDGWLSESLLIVDPEAIEHVPFVVQAAPRQAAAQVINGGNLRDSPDGTANIVAGVDAGDVLQFVGQAHGWWQVRTAAATSWIHSSLVKLDPRGAQTIPAIPMVAVANSSTTAMSAQRAKQQAVLPGASQPALLMRSTPPRRASDGTLRLAPQPVLSHWPTEEGPGNLVRLTDVDAPHAFLASGAVGPFNRARTRILQASGVDYLGQLDDAFRSIGFVTHKAGVADRSWHKAGRAIDVAQWLTVGGQQGVVFIRDASTPGLWRVLVRSARQDGSHGGWYGRAALQGRGPAAYYVDATAILQAEGWQRIGSNAGVTEAWHYQYMGGLSWWQAMAQLYGVKVLQAFYAQ
ncbi:MAG: SH3 domain-containing protein [Herpetosiphonaceae bacterium]|nr:SH3 domain-containing protein [Herpetosiphonaceae bacterium]